MEVVEIKEILRKASVEVDIQGHGKHIALFESDFERVAIEIKQKISKPDVVRCAFLVQHKYTLINHGLFDSEEKAKKYINGSNTFAIQEVEIA